MFAPLAGLEGALRCRAHRADLHVPVLRELRGEREFCIAATISDIFTSSRLDTRNCGAAYFRGVRRPRTARGLRAATIFAMSAVFTTMDCRAMCPTAPERKFRCVLDFLVVRFGRLFESVSAVFSNPIGQELVDRGLPPEALPTRRRSCALGLQVERPFRAIRLTGLLGESSRSGFATAPDLLD